MKRITLFLITGFILVAIVPSGWCEYPGKPLASHSAVNYQALVRESLDQLVAAYEVKNARDFIALVSESYTGDADILEGDIRRQFSQFTNMSIRYTFNNVTFDGKGKIFAAVTFSKGYTDVKTGKQVSRQGQTAMIFILDKNVCLLYSMNNPALFGL